LVTVEAYRGDGDRVCNVLKPLLECELNFRPDCAAKGVERVAGATPVPTDVSGYDARPQPLFESMVRYIYRYDVAPSPGGTGSFVTGITERLITNLVEAADDAIFTLTFPTPGGLTETFAFLAGSPEELWIRSPVLVGAAGLTEPNGTSRRLRLDRASDLRTFERHPDYFYEMRYAFVLVEGSPMFLIDYVGERMVSAGPETRRVFALDDSRPSRHVRCAFRAIRET
jgi:hypothetical protein